MDLIAGHLIDEKLRILEPLGAGGFASVYKALHLQLNKEVALKILHRQVLAEDVLARFKQEAQICTALSSPHLVRIFSHGTLEDGSPYLVMELVEGRPLNTVLAEDGEYEPKEAIRLIIQLLRGLEAAHSMKVIHRDLKPSNILVTNSQPPSVKVSDFGLAKLLLIDQSLTVTGEVHGTPHYMSPEQISGKTIDTRSDLYGVGCILYEMLTGYPPYVAEDYYGIAQHHFHSPVPQIIGVSESLNGVITTAMAKDADKRFQTSQDFIDQLEGIDTQSDAGPAASNVVRRLLQSCLRPHFAGLTLVASIVVVVALFGWNRYQERRVDGLLREAQSLDSQGRNPAAILKFDEAVRNADPSDSSIYDVGFAIAQRHFTAKRYGFCRKFLVTLSEKGPKQVPNRFRVRAWRDLGRCYLKFLKPKLAITCFHQALAIMDKRETPPRDQIILLSELANAQFEIQDWAECQRTTKLALEDRVLSVKTVEPRLTTTLVGYRYQSLRNLKEDRRALLLAKQYAADKSLSYAFQLEFTQDWLNAADVVGDNTEIAAAVTALLELMYHHGDGDKPDFRPFMNQMVSVYAATKRPREGIALCERYMSCYDNVPTDERFQKVAFFKALGRLYLNVGECAKAEKSFSQALAAVDGDNSERGRTQMKTCRTLVENSRKAKTKAGNGGISKD